MIGIDPTGEPSQGEEELGSAWLTTPSLRRLLTVFSLREERRQEGVTRYSQTPQPPWQDRPATLLDQVGRWRYVSSDSLSRSSTRATPSPSGGPRLIKGSRETSRPIRERRRRRPFPPSGPRPGTTVSPSLGEGLLSGRRRDIDDRKAGRRAFRLATAASRPGIRPQLRLATKRVAARFFQLLSGHAMIAPFLKERWGLADSDICWWCRKGRQSREHL